MGSPSTKPMTEEEPKHCGLAVRGQNGSLILPAETPEMPADLPGDAQAEWKRVAPLLLELGVLTRLDRGVLVQYVRTYALNQEAARELERDGVLAAGWRNGEKKHPAWQVYRDSCTMLTALRKELGLSPATRSRLNVVQPYAEPTDPYDRMMAGLPPYPKTDE